MNAKKRLLWWWRIICSCFWELLLLFLLVGLAVGVRVTIMGRPINWQKQLLESLQKQNVPSQPPSEE
jgi:hypothetical protein